MTRRHEPPQGRPKVIWRMRRLSDLHEDPKNVRQHPDRNRAAVKASLDEWGQVVNLVVEAGTDIVIGGNCTLGEARSLGFEEVMCSEVDMTGRKPARLAVALNRTSELAEWDAEGLASILGDLGDLESLGMDDMDLGDPLEEVTEWGTDGSPATRPPVLTLAVRVSDSTDVERAIERAMSQGAATRGDALAVICREWSDE